MTAPPQWERLAKRQRAALVAAEVASLAGLRRTVERATAPLLARLSRLPSGGAERRATAESAIEHVRNAAPAVTRALTTTLAASRLRAKGAALDRLKAEWTLVQREVRAAGFPDPGPLSTGKATATPTDRAVVESTSSAYAAAWTLGATTALWTWEAGEGDGGPAAAVSAATEEQDYRLRRIATTDTAQAFADARDEATAAEARARSGATWIPALLKRWDAALDRVCPRCRALADTLRPWGVGWPGGAEPGHVHPGCRCLSHTVFIPTRIPDLSSEAA